MIAIPRRTASLPGPDTSLSGWGATASSPGAGGRLQDLPLAVAAALRSAGSQRTWRRGQTVLRQGQHSGALLVALQGRLAVRLGHAGGHDTLLRWLEDGELVALPDVLAHLPAPVSIVAQGPAVTLHIEREAFIAVLQQQPEGAISIALLLARRLGELFRYVEQNQSRPLADRVRNALSRLARSHAQDDGHGGLRLTLTQADLATAAGASRQRVHLVLQQWQAQGHLRLGYGGLTLLPAGQWCVDAAV